MTPYQHRQATAVLADAWSVMEDRASAEAREKAAGMLLDVLDAIMPEPEAAERDREHTAGRPVVDRLSPAIRYPSVRACAEAIGVRPSAVQWAIKLGRRCCGHYLRYEDVPEPQCPAMRLTKEKAVIYRGVRYPSINAVAAAVPCPPTRSPQAHFEWLRRRVRVEGDERQMPVEGGGRWWPSAREAAKALEVARSTVIGVCNGSKRSGRVNGIELRYSRCRTRQEFEEAKARGAA